MIILKNVTKSFEEKTVISNFSMEIRDHEFVAITGPSGSGETTLLNLIGLLDQPSIKRIWENNRLCYS